MKKLASLLIIAIFMTSFIPIRANPKGALFKITMVAPGTANLLRRQWALIIANSFQAVGIDARVVFLSWGAVYDRILTPARENLGKTFDEGGWDALFIGWTPGLYPLGGIFQIHYSKNFAPTGSNYYLWNNTENDRAIEDFMAAGYTAAGEEAFKRWQRNAFEETPKSVIVYQAAPIVASTDIDFQGYEWLYDNVGCVPQFLKTTRKSVVFGTTGEIVALNPPLSNSWYDTVVFSPIMENLFTVDAEKNIRPALAESYEVSADGRTFTYHLRTAKWHDGVDFTADDVLFSIWAYINPATGTQLASYVAGFIGEDITFKWENGTETRLVFDPDTGDGWYPAPPHVTRTRKARVEAVDAHTVKITIADFGTLGRPTAIFHPEGDTSFYIIPKHVLESVPPAEWATHPFNTGTGTYTSNGQTFSGPIGTGPYKWESYDSVRATVHLVKYENYWNRTALEAQGMFGIEDYYIRYIIEKDPAIAALKNDEVQILDQNYQLQRDVAAGTFQGWARVYKLEGTGIQELGYNMRHPIWGTGVDTPLGKSDPSKAALAAKYVRQAFDYLIPRQLIIDNLLAGYGSPGITHAAPTQLYFDTTLSPRPYDPEMAKSLLAAAGYETGVPPPSTVTTVSTILLGMPVELSGRFVVEPEAALKEGGFIVLLQSSTDNNTWTNVAQSVTTTGGYYSITYQPKSKGTYYFRVYLPGTGAKTASVSGATGPDFPYDGIPRAIDSQYSPTTVVTVTSLEDVIKPLQDEISSLRSQVSSLTTVAYGLGIIAILIGALGLFLSFRKKS